MAVYRPGVEYISWLIVSAIIVAAGLTISVNGRDQALQVPDTGEPLKIRVMEPQGAAAPSGVSDSLQGAQSVDQSEANTLQQSPDITNQLQPNSGNSSF